MSEATICDRCGVAAVKRDGEHGKVPAKGWRSVDYNKHFCPDCSKSFEEWRTQGKKQS